MDTGLIPCADGGSSLDDWKEGGQQSCSETSVSEQLSLKTAKRGAFCGACSATNRVAEQAQLFLHAAALTGLAQRLSEVKGILWHQGEADSETEEKAADYKARFLAMIEALKRECSLENAPVVLGELGEFLGDYQDGACRYFPLVNRALTEIAAALPRCGLASAQGLISNGDNLHFNAASLREFGRRYFEGYLRVSGSRE